MALVGNSTFTNSFQAFSNTPYAGTLNNALAVQGKATAGIFTSGTATDKLFAGEPITINRSTGASANALYNTQVTNQQLAKATGTAATTGSTTILGFTVSSPTDYVASGDTVASVPVGYESVAFRLGSDAEVWVPVTAALLAVATPAAESQKLSWNFTTSSTAPYGALDVGVSNNYLPVQLLEVQSGFVITLDANGKSVYTPGAVGLIRLMAPQNPIT